MQFAKALKLFSISALVITLAACGSKGGVDDSAMGTADSGMDTESSATAYSAAEAARLEAERMAAEEAAKAAEEQARLLGITTFYFDFDQSVIKPEARAALEAHAANLINNGGKVVLEGHADERGTREYNLALGERRAESVERYLTVLGVSSSQIETVSYGEERPASLGHDDSSWSLNRRVELRYE